MPGQQHGYKAGFRLRKIFSGILVLECLRYTCTRHFCFNAIQETLSHVIAASLSEYFLSHYCVTVPNKRKIWSISIYMPELYTIMITHLLHTKSLFEINNSFCKYSWHEGMITISLMTSRHYIIFKKTFWKCTNNRNRTTISSYNSFLSIIVHNHVHTEFIQKQSIHLMQVMIIENRATA